MPVLIPTYTIDCTNQVIDIRIDDTNGDDAAIAFINVPPSGTYTELTILITYPTGFMPSHPYLLWPPEVHFPDNRPPTLAAHSNVIRLITVDGGVNWYGTHDTVIDVFSRLATTATNGQVVTYRNGWVTETPSGGGGGTDYYATIYNLQPDLSISTPVLIDPADGYTQYCNITGGNASSQLFRLRKGLATGIRWTVRVMITVTAPESSFDQYTQANWWDGVGGVDYGNITWIEPEQSGIYVGYGDIMVYELFTIDGGNTWIGSQLQSRSFAPN